MRLLMNLIVLFLLLPLPVYAAGEAQIPGVWKIDLGDDKVYGIRFAGVPSAPTQMCGILHWLKEPRMPNGDWKLDVKNPKSELQERKILGLTLLGRLQPVSDNQLSGRVYLPDLGTILFSQPNGVSCDVTVTFNREPASAEEASVAVRAAGFKCRAISYKYPSIKLVRQTAAPEGPTAAEARCDYQE